MAVLRKFDVAVILEAAGFNVSDDGLTFLLDENAETFATAWRELNCERNVILEAFAEAGPNVDRQLEAAMDVIQVLLLAIGIEPRGSPSGPALRPAVAAASADLGASCIHGLEPSCAPALQGHTLLHGVA